MRAPVAIAVFVALSAAAGNARAEHAAIDLRVYAPKDEKSAVSDQEPPAGGVNDRPLLKVKAGEPLVVQFFLTNVYPHSELKDVTVAYFVAPLSAAGKKLKPAAGAEPVTEGAFTLHFKPKCRVGSRFQLTIAKPGAYLVRVGTENTKSDHEHFAAIELLVE